MNMVIWKYWLEIANEQIVPLSKGAKILSVGYQPEHKNVFLWALINQDENEIDHRKIYIYGTGHPLTENIFRRHFIGTVMTNNGKLVWHIFE